MKLLKFCFVLSIVLLSSAFPGQATLVIGGFNSDRIGVGSITDGPIAEEFRSLISSKWSGATFVGTDFLSASFLSTVDVLFIGAPRIGGATYLSSDEQQNLLNFINVGGGAIIFGDNDDYAGVPVSDNAAESFLDPFGVDITGHMDGLQLAHGGTLDHPIMNGPHGVVETIATYHGGWFNGLGSYAAKVAEFYDNGEAAVAAIPKYVLTPEAGGVVFLSDADMLVDSADGGHFGTGDNQTLVLNSVAYVIPEPSTAFLGIVGFGVLAAWRRRV